MTLLSYLPVRTSRRLIKSLGRAFGSSADRTLDFLCGLLVAVRERGEHAGEIQALQRLRTLGARGGSRGEARARA
mgnify:CR=1 FL=1